MINKKIFISYSHKDTEYLNELVTTLKADSRTEACVWFDVQNIRIGDRFHAEIQRTLPESRVAILLLSEHFFTSDYVKHHELPVLIEKAEARTIDLGCVYVTPMTEGALKRPVEVSGRRTEVDLRAYIGANGPKNPLINLDPGERKDVYVKLTDWAAERLKSSSRSLLPIGQLHHQREPGPRYDLAVRMQRQGKGWRHSFSLENAPDFYKPDLDCPPLHRLPDSEVTEEDLFQLLFGRDEQKSGTLFGAAFDAGLSAEPTRRPLRVRLMTDDDRLCALPWTEICYRGRTLHHDGWTVELHPDRGPGFPEYPSHTCLFPGKVVLVASRDTAEMAHFGDLQHFFQRRWQDSPEPVIVDSVHTLRAELQGGSTRLVYCFAPASNDGLLLEGAEAADRGLSWTELAEVLEQTRSVSAVFLNLLGEPSRAAVSKGRVLVQAGRAKAVLFQCNERANAARAAKAGLDTLADLLAGEQLDPVVALHRHHQGLAVAWTRYSTWRLVAPKRLEHPDLVDLLLDRRNQRAELLQAKADFYTYQARRIYHAVAFGSQGCRVDIFPNTAGQHLRLYGREDREVLLQQNFPLKPGMTSADRVGTAVRQRLRLEPRASVIRALIREETSTGGDFWFLVLGWTLPGPVPDADTTERVIRAVTDWCHDTLGEDLAAVADDINVRVISVLALETPSDEIADTVEDTVAELSERYDDEEVFHVGELHRLAGVRRQDLRHFFQDNQICHCDERYRKEFPALLLAGRSEMPFDEAVKTIRRGERDNWGNLFEQLDAMTKDGTWPPETYAPDFWEHIDDR